MSSALLVYRSALRRHPSVNNFRFIPSRTYYPSPTCLSKRPLERTSWQKLWYRSDGNQRSKVKGLVYVTIVSFGAVLFEATRQRRGQTAFLATIAEWQQIDAKYSLDNSLDTADTVAAYTTDLLCSVPMVEHSFEQQRRHIADLFRLSRKVAPEHYENIREILKEIHCVFMRDQDVEKTVKEAAIAVHKLILGFEQLARDCETWAARQEEKTAESSKGRDEEV